MPTVRDSFYRMKRNHHTDSQIGAQISDKIIARLRYLLRSLILPFKFLEITRYSFLKLLNDALVASNLKNKTELPKQRKIKMSREEHTEESLLRFWIKLFLEILGLKSLNQVNEDSTLANLRNEFEN